MQNPGDDNGTIDNISDFVEFECDNLMNAEKEFHSVVDDYIDFVMK